MTRQPPPARRSAVAHAVLSALLITLGACSSEDGRLATLSAATPAAGRDSVRVRRLFADSGTLDFAGGSISRDGRFVTGMDASGDLALRDLRSGAQRALTHAGDFAKGNNALNSRISPDGKHVAFIWSFGAPSYAFELRVIGADGSAQRVLRSGPAFASNVPGDWTPDSRRLVVSVMAPDQTHSIALLTLADGSMRTLKSLDWRYPGSLRVSPDGRRVAYSVAPERGSNERDIYLLDLDGTSESRLTTDGEPKNVVGWSADGQTLYYRARKGDANAVWHVKVRNGARADTPALVRSDVWGMVPIDVVGGTIYYAVAMQRVAVRSMSLELEHGQPVTSTKIEAAGVDLPETGRVAWSPDGRRLAYVRTLQSPSGARTALVLRDVSAGSDHQLPLPLGRTEIREWAADGRSIIVVGYERGTPGRYEVDLTSGKAKLMDRLIDYNDVPQRSPDRRIEYVVRGDSATDSAAVIARGTAGDARVLFRDRRINRAVLSPDGKYLAVHASSDAADQSTYVVIVPTSGGAARVVRSASAPRRINVPLNWTRDSRTIVMSEVASQKYEFWKARVDIDSTQRVAALTVPAAYSHLNPDGRRLAFVSLDGPNVQELWVLESIPGAR